MAYGATGGHTAGGTEEERIRIRIREDRHDRRRLSLAINILLGLLILCLVIPLWMCLASSHVRVVAGPTVTATETGHLPVVPAPPSTVYKTVIKKVVVTRNASRPRPSPIQGPAPNGKFHGIIQWVQIIHLGPKQLLPFCPFGSTDVFFPPVANDTGAHIHCVGDKGQNLGGFNMTRICDLVPHMLLPNGNMIGGLWGDEGNENNPNRWECQRVPGT
jgi:hypothetical protein